MYPQSFREDRESSGMFTAYGPIIMMRYVESKLNSFCLLDYIVGLTDGPRGAGPLLSSGKALNHFVRLLILQASGQY